MSSAGKRLAAAPAARPAAALAAAGCSEAGAAPPRRACQGLAAPGCEAAELSGLCSACACPVNLSMELGRGGTADMLFAWEPSSLASLLGVAPLSTLHVHNWTQTWGLVKKTIYTLPPSSKSHCVSNREVWSQCPSIPSIAAGAVLEAGCLLRLLIKHPTCTTALTMQLAQDGTVLCEALTCRRWVQGLP